MKFEDMTPLQRRLHNAAIVIETEGDEHGFAGLLREAIASATPEQSSEVVSQSLTDERASNVGLLRACVKHLRGHGAFFDDEGEVTDQLEKAADMLDSDAREIEQLKGKLSSMDVYCGQAERARDDALSELDKANLHIKHIGNDALRSENARLRAELAALKADAARYRWLRDIADAADWESLGYQVDIDASIDALMKGAS